MDGVVSRHRPDVCLGHAHVGLHRRDEGGLQSEGVDTWRAAMHQSKLLAEGVGSSFSGELHIEIENSISVVIVGADLVLA